MKKIFNIRFLSVLTNFLLIVVISIVFTVGFTYKTTVQISGSYTIEPIYRGNEKNKNVSIMFNVYENTDVVNEILSVLKEYNAKATFFVGGCWADDNQETLNKIIQEGHEIGNHGYFHKDHKNLSYEGNLSEINLTDGIVSGLCGYKMNLFAPPSGSFSKKTLDASSDLGYKVIMWSKDTIDWRDNDKDLIFERATKNLKNGDLVLMHPKKHTLEVLPNVISFYLHSGFSVVTVSQNII